MTESLYKLALSSASSRFPLCDGLPPVIANDLLAAWMERSGAEAVQRTLSGVELPSNVTVLRVCSQDHLPAKCDQLQELAILPNQKRAPPFNSQAFNATLGSFPWLRSLDLSRTTVRDAAFLGIAGMLPHLENVVLEGCVKLGDAALTSVMQVPRLALLDVRKISNFTNAGFRDACLQAQCKGSLSRLLISQAGKLRDEAIAAMAESFQDSLLALTINQCFAVTDASLVGIGKMRSLQCLDLSSCCKITGEGLRHLSNLVNLVEFIAEFADNLNSVTPLSVAPCVVRSLQVAFCRAFTPQALMEVSKSFSNLIRLRIQNGERGLQIEDSFLIDLAASSGVHLEELQLHPCSVGDAGLCALALRAKRLQVLHLSGARLMIGNESLALLASECPLVRSVSMGRLLGDASDDTMVTLTRQLTALEMLDLNFHTLSSQGLIEASRFCARLKVLSLRHCTQLTNAAIVALMRQAPEITTLDLGKCTSIDLEGILGACERGKRLRFLNVSEIGIDRKDVASLRSRFPWINVVE